MPRGVRKSPLEKLRESLKETQDAAAQHKAAIEALKEKEKQIREQIKLEELKELSDLLDEHNMSASELKNLLESQKTE
ncbi:hypothetical protein AALB39_05035 [Lachnospiraceae bacterium 54-53]